MSRVRHLRGPTVEDQLNVWSQSRGPFHARAWRDNQAYRTRESFKVSETPENSGDPGRLGLFCQTLKIRGETNELSNILYLYIMNGPAGSKHAYPVNAADTQYIQMEQPSPNK